MLTGRGEMDLHPKVREGLVQILTKAIPEIVVKNNMFVDDFSVFSATFDADSLLPQNGKTRNQLDDWFGTHPFFDFIKDRVGSDLRNRDDYVIGDEVQSSLSVFDGYNEPAAAAERLVAEFASLPWRYALSIKLPESFKQVVPLETTSVELSKDSEVINSTLFLEDELPLRHPEQRVTRKIHRSRGLVPGIVVEDPKWDNKHPYLLTKVAGFVGPYGFGAADESIRAFKRFLGLGIALDVFRYDVESSADSSDRDIYVHREVDGRWLIDNRIELPQEESDVLKRCFPRGDLPDGAAEDKRMAGLHHRTTLLSNTLSSPRSDTITLAAEWFFDSYKGFDQVLSYVRQMICLEIILGEHADTSKLSLGDLLGNRLAYLIGKSHVERSAILSEFKNVYKVRSKIVHHGKHKLTIQEHEHRRSLQLFCKRALQEESILIAADI
jgi:hypothetical protein